ncbi:hypothetical protein PQX77_010252 [Marasmius sp. AFHP31]|nr:hypothetical protein PQX77_010252 [Marasmius sp. AFHP31]
MAPTSRLAFMTLTLVSSVFAAPLEVRQTYCADIMVIYARGTAEQPPIGDSQSVGAIFRDKIRSRLGARSLYFQGVDYPALILGFLAGGSPTGSRTMAEDITRTANYCPNAKIILAGYSQGAQLVHNSAEMLTSAVTDRISAVVTFGDPYQNQAVGSVPSSKVLIICNEGDNICEGGINPFGPHLTYQEDAPFAVQFVVSKV